MDPELSESIREETVQNVAVSEWLASRLPEDKASPVKKMGIDSNPVTK